jgi:ribosomal protein S18 acetylase RimI-like enzyme
MNEIPDLNLFMVCEKLNQAALSDLPAGFRVRTCRKDELDIWKAMHFDEPETAVQYRGFMDDYFANHYAPKGDLFFETCLFVCDDQDKPVATCFAWKQYDQYTTIHWFKVIKPFEGQGIGRALLSLVMQPLHEEDYPVYLHTQPSSYRAIKLYTDFGFAMIDLPIIDNRVNGLRESMGILKKYMPERAYQQIRIVTYDEQTERFYPVTAAE